MKFSIKLHTIKTGWSIVNIEGSKDFLRNNNIKKTILCLLHSGVALIYEPCHVISNNVAVLQVSTAASL